jgi:hypothetical protein
MMSEEEKVRENRLRRKIERMGYMLMKSRARDPDALTYGGFQIVDPETKMLIAGWGNAERGYALDLDGVEAWIAADDEDVARADTAVAAAPDPLDDPHIAALVAADEHLQEQARTLMESLGYTKLPDGSFKPPTR